MKNRIKFRIAAFLIALIPLIYAAHLLSSYPNVLLGVLLLISADNISKVKYISKDTNDEG